MKMKHLDPAHLGSFKGLQLTQKMLLRHRICRKDTRCGKDPSRSTFLFWSTYCSGTRANTVMWSSGDSQCTEPSTKCERRPRLPRRLARSLVRPRLPRRSDPALGPRAPFSAQWWRPLQFRKTRGDEGETSRSDSGF